MKLRSTDRPTVLLLAVTAFLVSLSALLAFTLEGGIAAALGSLAPSESEMGADTGANDLHPAYLAAADALRRGDCRVAQLSLVPLATAGDEAHLARLTKGFYAHVCGEAATAVAELRSAAAPGSLGLAAAATTDAAARPSELLEDWRLLLLAENARATGQAALAQAALAQLLTDHRRSPLWERALIAAIEQNQETGHPEQALELVRWSREQEGLSNAAIARAETLAWEIGRARADLTVQSRAARRLLTHAPMTAAELGVVELFRHPEGRIDWRAILTSEDLFHRAESLLASGLADSALTTLAEIPRREREFDWLMLEARALVRAKRADEALETLERTAPTDLEEQAEVEWLRALATADLASAMRSGGDLSPAERQEMTRRSHRHLARVVRLDADRELAREALERLFEDYADGGEFDRAMGALRVLRRLDPDDTTGASHLWKLGWVEYQKKDYNRAIGYWSELVSIYPGSRQARSGRYWTGRAFDQLGRHDRARDIFREIATSDTTDFYRKRAIERLAPTDGPVVSARPAIAERDAPPAEPWPHDPTLERAHLLTDLGLDQLALTELEGLGDRPSAKAANALRGLALSRQGKKRASIPYLRRAFPALGGPYQASVPLAARQLYYPLAFADEIEPAAERTGLPAHLVFGIIREESAFDVTASSRVGARGLMQVMPATGKEVAGKIGLPFSPEMLDQPAYNVRLGTTYFKQVLDMFDGNVELALAGYNGGPYRMKRLWREAGPRPEMDYWLEALPIDESRDYVKRITVFSDSYQQLYGG